MKLLKSRKIIIYTRKENITDKNKNIKHIHTNIIKKTAKKTDRHIQGR